MLVLGGTVACKPKEEGGRGEGRTHKEAEVWPSGCGGVAVCLLVERCGGVGAASVIGRGMTI